jgi:hypothetical protein
MEGVTPMVGSFIIQIYSLEMMDSEASKEWGTSLRPALKPLNALGSCYDLPVKMQPRHTAPTGRAARIL